MIAFIQERPASAAFNHNLLSCNDSPKAAKKQWYIAIWSPEALPVNSKATSRETAFR